MNYILFQKMDYRQVILVLLSIVVCSVNARHGCENGQYYSTRADACLPCSGCHDNEIIKRPCHRDQDTVCGVLKKFHFFHHHKQSNEEKTDIVAKTTVYPTASSEIFDDDEKWFTITMVLVGILVLTCVAGVIIVLVTCVVCKRKEREIICEPGKKSFPSR